MRIDLHCHTEFSGDSSTPLGAIPARCREQSIGVQAITDHGTIEGAQRLRTLVESQRDEGQPGLTIIVGEEITTQAGELVGLFLDECIPVGLSSPAQGGQSAYVHVLTQPYHPIALAPSHPIHGRLYPVELLRRHLKLEFSDPVDHELDSHPPLAVLVDQVVGFLVKGCWQLVAHRFEGTVTPFDDLLLSHHVFRSHQ